MSSFAKNASAEPRLVIKNRPLNPGLVDLARMTQVLAVERGIADRIDFIDGGNLAARAGSSAGWWSTTPRRPCRHWASQSRSRSWARPFLHRLPHDQRPIHGFSTDPAAPAEAMFKRFKPHAINRTQINGNYHEPGARKHTARALACRFAAAR